MPQTEAWCIDEPVTPPLLCAVSARSPANKKATRIVQASKRLRCVVCGRNAKMTHGWRWSDAHARCIRRKGEALCEPCRIEIRDELEEYFPAPPDMPGCYQIARTRHDKRISVERGVTLLLVGGRYTEARALKASGYESVARVRVA